MTFIVITALKTLYVALLVTIIACLFKPMLRAFTKSPMAKDFDYMLFWMLAFNRLWFFARAVAYPNKIDAPYEAAVTIVVYMFACAAEAGVLASYAWSRKR